jgi:branched-chain amino acid transport system permease protein
MTRATWALNLIALVMLSLMPYLVSDFHLLLLTQILIFGLLAASLDLLVGYTGLPSLGHAACFGVGGYTTAVVAKDLSSNGFWQIGAAVAAATAVAAVTGWLAVRTRGVYFLMLTLAFSQLLFSLALTWTRVTGGSNGLAGIPRVRLMPGFTLTDELRLYYYVLVACLLAFFLLRRIVASPFGRTLQGIRENEGRMRSLGHATTTYKLASFCIAGAVAGYAGALFAQHERFVSPAMVSFEVSALALVMMIVGGSGTLYGAVLGAATVILLRDELSSRFEERWQLMLGLVFILTVYVLPGGVAGFVRRLSGRLQALVAGRGRVVVAAGTSSRSARMEGGSFDRGGAR